MGTPLDPKAVGRVSGREHLCDEIEAARRANPKLLARSKPRTVGGSLARALVLAAAEGNLAAISALNQINDWKRGGTSPERISHCSENSLSQGISEGISEKVGT